MTARLIAGLAGLAVAAGCTGGDGGAVELSWRLRPAEGLTSPSNSCAPFVCCDQTGSGTGPIARIQLGWQVGSAVGEASWSCDLGDGTTGFDLPSGDALLTISPVCSDGPAAPATYSAPAAIARTVVAGDAIDLGAVELVLEVSSCTYAGQPAGTESQPCICAP